jgi:hypothetical protein
VFILKITKNLKNMSDTASQTVEIAKSAAVNLKNASGPLAAGKFLMDTLTKFNQVKKSKTKK